MYHVFMSAELKQYFIMELFEESWLDGSLYIDQSGRKFVIFCSIF